MNTKSNSSNMNDRVSKTGHSRQCHGM